MRTEAVRPGQQSASEILQQLRELCDRHIAEVRSDVRMRDSGIPSVKDYLEGKKTLRKAVEETEDKPEKMVKRRRNDSFSDPNGGVQPLERSAFNNLFDSKTYSF